MIELKVCGMRDLENLKGLAAIKPDFVGLIFYPKSPRYIGDDVDSQVLSLLSGFENKVGVFVNETVGTILEKAAQFKLNFIQLHGNEPVGICQKLKEKGLKVIKVFSVIDTLPIKSIAEYSAHVDYFLFDTKTPGYGGSGKIFNWEILQNYRSHVPYFLSGGIGLEEIKELDQHKLPGLFAVDVNSKVEVKAGFKNLEMIRELKSELNEYTD